MPKERPEIVTDEMIIYLDRLRESAVTNMYGAGPWLEREFGLTRYQAKDVVLYYMSQDA